MDATQSLKASNVGFQLSPARRLLMLGLNYLPLLHLLACAATVGIAWGPLPWRVGGVIGLLYLVPALAARILLALAPIPEGRIRVGTAAFFTRDPGVSIHA